MVATDSTRDVLLVALAELGACSPRTLEKVAARLEESRTAVDSWPESDDAHDAFDALLSILRGIAKS